MIPLSSNICRSRLRHCGCPSRHVLFESRNAYLHQLRPNTSQRRSAVATARSVEAAAADTSGETTAEAETASTATATASAVAEPDKTPSGQAEEGGTVWPDIEDMEVSQVACSILSYALDFARVSETYQTHSWMLLLGLLKHEGCRAAGILKDLGLEDLYGAWNEVLWALNVSNGLKPRAFKPSVSYSGLASQVVAASATFARLGHRRKVQSEDLLMALASAGVLEDLFPDLKLTFARVRKAAAKRGCKYELPDDTLEGLAGEGEEDSFL